MRDITPPPRRPGQIKVELIVADSKPTLLVSARCTSIEELDQLVGHLGKMRLAMGG